MSQEEKKSPQEQNPSKDKSGSISSQSKKEIHIQPTRPTKPVGTAPEEPPPDIDEGPRPGPVDEIQEALFDAAQAGAPTDVEFDELADPVPDIDEGPRPGPVDEVQEALFDAAKEGVSTELDLDDLPPPDPPIHQKVVKFKPKTTGVEPDESAEKETTDEEAPQGDGLQSGDAIPHIHTQDEGTLEEQPEPATLSITTEFWFLLAVFASFRLLTLFLLRPGGFIRDWSDFDTYFGIAALSDYGLFPFTHFWLEWPPLVPWLSVGAYRLALLLPPWTDDPRLWFILILGSVFVLFEIGNFILIFRLARRLLQDQSTINRVLWLYAGLFIPVYTMLGFFDGVALFFILLALDLLLNKQRFPSAIAAGVGVMVKIIPGLMLPVAARQIWHKYRHNNKDAAIEMGLYAVAFGLTIVILSLPFLIIGPQWVAASVRSMLGRASWETIWAVMEGYTGFGVVLGDRLNPAETNFAVHRGWLSNWWWLVTLAFVGLYAFIFTRKADYGKTRNVVAFSGLTVAVFLLYSKGYSPQFLVYLLPFIILLMPNGRGLTYALVLTGLNVLEQPIYFVLLPDATWLLTFVVIARFILTVVIAIEFALVIWPAQEQNPALAQAQQYAPHVFAGLGVLSLIILIPLMLQAYSGAQLVNTPVGALAGFMKTQAPDNQAGSPKPRLILSDQATYRQLYPYLRQSFDLQLSDGPNKGFTGSATLTDLLQGQNQVWVLPTGSQQAALTNAIAARGTELAAYEFDGLGTAMLYTFEANPLPTIPPARFIGGIDLLGHRVDYGRNAINLTLYWRAQNPQSQKLTVFTQLLNADGELVASHDSVPNNGAAPVTEWAPGSVQADPHRILLPPDLPPGQYTLTTGLYNDFNERVRSIDQDGIGHANRAVVLEIIELR